MCTGRSTHPQEKSVLRSGATPLPALKHFAPELILISAGFDGHSADEMANLRLSTTDYAWVTTAACTMADRHAQGRIVSTLEGGYDLRALAQTAVAHIERLVLA